MFDIYRHVQELNNKHNSNWFITENPRILTYGLNTYPEIQELFYRHRYESMTAPLGKSSSMMVREFYALYAATIEKKTSAKEKKLDNPPLFTTLF